MNYLSLDVGTTCCKCQLFSEEGDILLYRSEEYPLAERDGEKYVDIESIWSIVQSLMLSAARAGGYASVCISTFGESFVLLDKEDKILFYPMLYTDPRGEEEAEEILKKMRGGTAVRARGRTAAEHVFAAETAVDQKTRAGGVCACG